jgi:quinol monooxygenase YgiN
VTIEYIRYRIADALQDEFEAAYAAAAVPLAASAHCLAFELSRGIEEPDRYVLRIEWDSVEGHMSGFRRSGEFRRFFSHIAPYVDAIDEMAHHEPTSVVG